MKPENTPVFLKYLNAEWDKVFGNQRDAKDKVIGNASSFFLPYFEKENKQMTREQALDKLISLENGTREIHKMFIDRAEALGLIKFEEEKSNYLKVIGTDSLGYTVTMSSVIAALREKGYEIISK